jgi:hypothetical protein
MKNYRLVSVLSLRVFYDQLKQLCLRIVTDKQDPIALFAKPLIPVFGVRILD